MNKFCAFDLATLEQLGAWDPLWADIHMGPEGAVRSFRALGGHGLLMPIHWGLFDLALHHWSQPIETIWRVEGLELWSPTPGVPSDVIAGEELAIGAVALRSKPRRVSLLEGTPGRIEEWP